MVELFGGKKEEEKEALSVDRILQMQQQGFSNDQIVQTLQREGYKSSEIFDMIQMADTRKGVAGAAYPPPPTSYPTGGYGAPGIIPPAGMGISTEKIEEIAEAIIDEKWDELVESVNKIIDWKDKVEGDLVAINERITQLNNNVQSIQKSVLGKVEEYDRTMEEVGTDVKAMTKVFQQILPGFVENVQELSRVTARVKGEKPKAMPSMEIPESKTTRKTARKTSSKTEEIFGGEGSENSIEDIE
jgi:DNA anti-recombination protein RmuC